MSWKRLGTALLVAAALALTILWPGDATWLSDEPRLLAEAWHANHDGELARGGLWGNFGIRYGPLPTWIYQALLLITHDPETLLLLRALLCAGATTAGLLWLARELRLPAWFAAAILAAPYVVQYHRLLWDASFAMPLGALTLAAFAHFLRTGSGKTLALTVAGAGLLPTIHPQALPFSLPLFGWLAWRHHPALRAHWKPLLALALVLLSTHAVWIVEAVFGFAHQLGGSVSHGYPNGAPRLACALAPLLGGNLIGGPGIAAQAPGAPLLLPLFGLYAVYPLVWAGIFVAAQRWRETSPRAAVGTVALAGLFVQAALFGLMRIPSGPQYFFGTFAMHAVLAWFAVDELRTLRFGTILGGAFAACAFAGTVGFASVVHSEGYAHTLGWAKLENQAAIARQLNKFSDQTVRTDAVLYLQHPQALRTLRLLLPREPGAAPRENGRLFIAAPHRVVCGGDFVNRGRFVLHERGSAGDLLDVTPLPKGWRPASW